MSLSLGLGLALTRNKGVGVKLRAVSTRGDIPIASFQATLANRVMIEGRTRHVVADDCTFIQVVDGGYYCTNSETNVGNDQSIERALEIPAGQSGGPTGAPYVNRFTYAGSNVGTIVDGVAEYVSDKVYASQFGLTKFPRGLIVWLRYRRQIALNAYHPSFATSSNVSGENSYFSDGLQTSQLMTTGSMSTPTGGASAGYSMLPLAIIGDVRRNLAILGIGDSIMYRSNDVMSDGSNGGGWFARALYSLGGRTYAWGRVARGTSTLQGYVASSTKRSALYKYFTNAVVHYGTNDGAGGRTSAQVLADAQTLGTALKAAGLRVRFSGVLPRCATTDTGATVANQTPISNFATGGAFRDPVNAGLLAAVGSSWCDQYFDLSTVVADVTFPDRWKAGYSTGDGVSCIHPNTGTVSADMGAAFAALVPSWPEV